MKEFKDKVAVVTGGASGIGRALAERFAGEGMKVVLADIDEEVLLRTEEELRQQGATVLGVLTDVSKAKEMEALARRTLESFGAIHIFAPMPVSTASSLLHRGSKGSIPGSGFSALISGV